MSSLLKPSLPSLRAQTVVALPPIEVWQAFTRAEHLDYWFGDAIEIDLRVGGAYIARGSYGIRLDTTVERLVEGRRLVLRPTRRGDDARIELDLVKLSGAETRVSVADPDAEDEGPWSEALENLRSMWERGVDLREARRTIMGIGPRDITLPERPIPGVPPGLGVRLGEVLAGGPAEAAGLLPGDVIVFFGSAPMRGGENLVRAIQARKPGDEILIRAVREGEEVRASVTLGCRNGSEEPPPGRLRLIETMRQAVKKSDAKLGSAVSGLSDKDAYRPEKADAWSVAQVLVHLSIVERMLQAWLDQTARGERPMVGSDPCTNATRIAGVLERRPGLQELLDRLREDEEETIAYLSHLPASVSAFKPRWSRMAFLAADHHPHSEDHLGQIARIRSAIGA
jgi:uncharacterized protein YndB with AHSA1/START domain/uncharacterized damage-inducible protein DinB